MPNWGEILTELQTRIKNADPNTQAAVLNEIRQDYLKKLYKHTKRNTIVYCSRWTQADGLNIPTQLISITPEDIQGFMAVMPGLKGDELDLIVHSPGGSAEATKAVVDYLRSKFKHIRVIVPQMAMSAATMLACAADEIILGKHSFLGPIDPQLFVPTPNGQRMITAQNVIEQFEMIARKVAQGANIAPYVPMLSQYGPDMLILCKNASDLSAELVERWLAKYMFKSDRAGTKKAKAIAKWLGTHSNFKSHGIFISRQELLDKKLDIKPLEEDPELQDLVLSVFHATTHLFNMSGAVKLIENQNGLTFMKSVQTQIGILQPQRQQLPQIPKVNSGIDLN
jgi:hypothetical protein